MAGPLNGIGGQQVPLATTFQPGQNTPVRSQDEDKTPKPNQVKPKGSQSAQSHDTDRNPKDLQSLVNSILASSDDSDKRRGSVVDITV